MGIKMDFSGSGIDEAAIEKRREEANKAASRLWSGELDFTGWVRFPRNAGEKDIREVEEAAAGIRDMCDVFVVLGVGGSYIGAKAVIDLLGNASGTEVVFAGHDFSSRYTGELFQKLADREICLCVISKSGSTAETMAGYGVFREFMLKRYGKKEAARRTFVVTENHSNYLHDLAENEGSRIFHLAEDIGGRYSVLTPVGMLPAAVSGVDIRGVIHGASRIASQDHFGGDTLDYAIVRQLLHASGKCLEVFSFFDPYAVFFGEWLKQLFAESEGKDGKGIFPTSLIFTRDLHSVGQFLQQGSRCLFETMITAREEDGPDVIVPQDSIEPYAGRTFREINACAERGLYEAHVGDGVPVIWIGADDFSAGSVGELLYFFEIQCAVSAMLSGVNPFDQPGVEAYKSAMRKYIKEIR